MGACVYLLPCIGAKMTGISCKLWPFLWLDSQAIMVQAVKDLSFEVIL